MVAQGGVATPSCDCASARNFLFARRTAWRVLASNRKYSSSIPNVYMRATTAPRELCSVITLDAKMAAAGYRGSRSYRRLLRTCRPSAAWFAAARRVDLLLEGLESDRANNDVVANHVAR